MNLAFAAVSEDSLPTYSETGSAHFEDVALTDINGANYGYSNGTVPSNTTQKKHGVAKVVVTCSTTGNMSLEQAIKALSADASFTVTISTPAPAAADPEPEANHARVHKAAPTVTENGYTATSGGVQATVTLTKNTGAFAIAAVSSSSVTNTASEKSLKFYYSVANASETVETTDNHVNDVIKAALS